MEAPIIGLLLIFIFGFVVGFIVARNKYRATPTGATGRGGEYRSGKDTDNSKLS